MTNDWFIHVNDADKRLFVSRPRPNPSGALSPCNMTPDDVDFEMSYGKSRRILEICGMNQQSFEYFVENYGENYEFLSFFKCQLISDFTPLESLKHLQGVSIYWNIRSSRLWDMSKNPELGHLWLDGTKKIAFKGGEVVVNFLGFGAVVKIGVYDVEMLSYVFLILGGDDLKAEITLSIREKGLISCLGQ